MGFLGTLLRNRHAGDTGLTWNLPGLDGPDTVTLSSPDFTASGPIPRIHVAKRAGGENLSPELRWSATPPGTAGWLLVIEDPDAPTTRPFLHCLALLDPALTGVPRGALAAGTTTPGVRVLNTRLTRGYRGPAPIKGHGPHRYVFQLFALAERLETPETVHYAEFVAGVPPVLARGRYEGTYER
ncbi:YbhB/YbcL family Raf kinase inhibitor-like protein [Nocardia stercoris]|uniref:YbhB/YbcL family Raf kinase inhibitor-like protein n=1 Tax=Nocardia stercoris TaxID=2483361 RepID=A0A3M2L6X9_9NOCA|nr:YbhB/YbcL family Raf kinase inhibitor-like protein [Nocardia stercoris]RMI33391.1 YbhB/YbcL family Raf kinase inhibitor-like protein [Nocardia stercoris]